MDTRVRVLLVRGDTEGALRAARAALEIDPTDRTWRSLEAESSCFVEKIPTQLSRCSDNWRQLRRTRWPRPNASRVPSS